jgi:UDP-glucose 4-epimerase
MDNIKNVLILGGSGFIGSALVNHLIKNGSRIRILVRKQYPVELVKNVELIKGDITNFDWRSLNDDPPETIFHLARISGVNRPSRFVAGLSGYLANRKLIRWVYTLKKPPLLIYTSGSLVYGSVGTITIDEDAPLNPISFQKSYILAEKPILKALKNNLIPVSIVRPPWVYGPGSWFKQFYYDLISNHDFVPQYGGGENLMTLIHVDDCALQMIMIAQNKQTGVVCNLVSGIAIRHEQFCKILSKLTNKKIKIIQNTEILKKYGKTVYEALTFSSELRSKHSLIQNYKGVYNHNHSVGLTQVLNELKKNEK